MSRELLIGCGNRRVKTLRWEGSAEAFDDLTTLDIDAACNPDVVFDLESASPLPFADDAFDEVHAYEVLEHCGTQGDWRLFFRQFNEFWRVLKPGGHFAATCPNWDSVWAWGDPGHSRVLTPQTLIFLSQAEYAAQVGRTHMTDYRGVYRGDFEVLSVQEDKHSWGFLLKALK